MHAIMQTRNNITHLPMHRRARLGLSYLPQESSVFRKLTVEENIRAILELQNLQEDEIVDSLQQLLGDLHIELNLVLAVSTN